MSDHVVKACKDCLPWFCLENLKCTYEDEGLALLSRKLLNCGALILGTPVYWWDASAMVKYLILKMFSNICEVWTAARTAGFGELGSQEDPGMV